MSLGLGKRPIQDAPLGEHKLVADPGVCEEGDAIIFFSTNHSQHSLISMPGWSGEGVGDEAESLDCLKASRWYSTFRHR